MKTLRFTGQFKKDAKRYRNLPDKMRQVLAFLQILANELSIPEKYKAHPLTGDYAGTLECHIAGDLLLIWMDELNDVIGIMRLGTHAELFGKGKKH